MKSPALAIFFTLLYIGIGHFYAGEPQRAVRLFLVPYALLAAGFAVFPYGFLLWIPVFLWAALDAQAAVKRHNADLNIR